MTRREYLFLHAPLFSLGIVFVILGTCFTVFPELLSHSPVSFETRGPIHHGWHYLILVGGFSLSIGLWYRNVRVEIAGLWACGLVVLLNLIALVASDVEATNTLLLSGMDGALRIAALVAIGSRLWVLLWLNPRITRDL